MPPYHVPSVATISRVCPQSLLQNELQDTIQVSFRRRIQLVDTTLCLLSLFTKSFPSKPEIVSNIGSLASEDSWTSNTLTRFWEAIARGGAQLDCGENTLSSVVSLLDFIRMFSTRISGFDSRSAVVDRTTLLCSQIATTFILTRPLPLPSPVEKELCLMVFDLALTDLKSTPGRQSFASNNLSKLLEVRQDHKRFDGFGQDLQVSASKDLADSY